MELGIAMIILLAIILTFSITIITGKIKNKRQK
jgi:hypothetical protein